MTVGILFPHFTLILLKATGKNIRYQPGFDGFSQLLRLCFTHKKSLPRNPNSKDFERFSVCFACFGY